MSKIVDTVRVGKRVTVTWTEEQAVDIGHHYCEWCDAETPEPTMDVLVAVVRQFRTEGNRATTVWPSYPADPEDPGVFCPPGWVRDDGDNWLCPLCAHERACAVTAAKQARQSGQG